MCIVIDTCCLATVFDGKNKEHPKFAPVLHWIKGKGRMIYGGTKYNTELGKAAKYLSYLAELSRQRKTIQIPTTRVDLIAAELKAKIPDKAFNDEHIVALVIASRCCVVCTNDDGAIAYLKRADLFKGYPGSGRPQIYRGHKTHKKLCCDRHIVGACLAGA
jgi:predicted nucleic acid-binding protein